MSRTAQRCLVRSVLLPAMHAKKPGPPSVSRASATVQPLLFGRLALLVGLRGTPGIFRFGFLLRRVPLSVGLVLLRLALPAKVIAIGRVADDLLGLPLHTFNGTFNGSSTPLRSAIQLLLSGWCSHTQRRRCRQGVYSLPQGGFPARAEGKRAPRNPARNMPSRKMAELEINCRPGSVANIVLVRRCAPVVRMPIVRLREQLRPQHP